MDPRVVIAGAALLLCLAGAIFLFVAGSTEGAVAVFGASAAPVTYLFGLHDNPPHPTGTTPEDDDDAGMDS